MTMTTTPNEYGFYPDEDADLILDCGCVVSHNHGDVWADTADCAEGHEDWEALDAARAR